MTEEGTLTLSVGLMKDSAILGTAPLTPAMAHHGPRWAGARNRQLGPRLVIRGTSLMARRHSPRLRSIAGWTSRLLVLGSGLSLAAATSLEMASAAIGGRPRMSSVLTGGRWAIRLQHTGGRVPSDAEQ